MREFLRTWVRTKNCPLFGLLDITNSSAAAPDLARTRLLEPQGVCGWAEFSQLGCGPKTVRFSAFLITTWRAMLVNHVATTAGTLRVFSAASRHCRRQRPRQPAGPSKRIGWFACTASCWLTTTSVTARRKLARLASMKGSHKLGRKMARRRARRARPGAWIAVCRWACPRVSRETDDPESIPDPRAHRRPGNNRLLDQRPEG